MTVITFLSSFSAFLNIYTVYVCLLLLYVVNTQDTLARNYRAVTCPFLTCHLSGPSSWVSAGVSAGGLAFPHLPVPPPPLVSGVGVLSHRNQKKSPSHLLLTYYVQAAVA